MKKKTLFVRKSKITYYTNTIKKDKQTLFFVPGLASLALFWEKSYEYFQNHYNVILIDLPGQKGSALTKHPFLQSVHAFKTILGKEGIKNANFVGQCLGSYILLELYKCFPRFVRTFIFVAPNYKNPASNCYTRDWSRFTKPVLWFIKAYSLSYFFHRYIHPGHVPLDEYVKDKKNIWLLYAKDTLATPPKTLYTYYKEMFSVDHTGILPKARVPALVIVGQNDNIFPPRIANDMHKQLPRSTLKIVDGDHSIAVKKATKLNKEIASFLKKHT